MPRDDWIAKYPKVQQLLQQPEEVLEYRPEGEAVVSEARSFTTSTHASQFLRSLRPSTLLEYPPTRQRIHALLARRSPCYRCGEPAVTVRVRFPDDLESGHALPDSTQLRYYALCRQCAALPEPWE